MSMMMSMMEPDFVAIIIVVVILVTDCDFEICRL